MKIIFSPPAVTLGDSTHHSLAAAGNIRVADQAITQLRSSLNGTSEKQTLLLKAAAGAGKSYVLRKLVADAIQQPQCVRVLVIAFTNKQIWTLADALGKEIGKGKVYLYSSKSKFTDALEAVKGATVVDSAKSIPNDVPVVLTTSHLSGSLSVRAIYKNNLSASHHSDFPFDVMFVDEAWQLPHHLFDNVTYAAPIVVGVGDVGQLPPLEIGTNPWRGDEGFNPYRAWPINYLENKNTWSEELPTVWRPCHEQLALWRAFYPEWKELNSVSAPGDRSIELQSLKGISKAIWEQVSTGIPTLVEVSGLPEAEAADVDLPLIHFAESLLDDLFASGFSLVETKYDDFGSALDKPSRNSLRSISSDPKVTILATRNQTVDDASDAVERLREKHDLVDSDLISSTVDSWQGQTNGITLAIHPLTGAMELDEFNSAFGRLAVTCTRATHGLLMLSRPGLDDLLNKAPVRPGTPMGEPGNRQLPRQTHQRILSTFARVTIEV